MLSAIAVAPPVNRATSASNPAAIAYIATAAPRTHAPVPHRWARRVSATNGRLGRSAGSARCGRCRGGEGGLVEFTEEHLLQRQLVAVQLDHVRVGQQVQ